VRETARLRRLHAGDALDRVVALQAASFVPSTSVEVIGWELRENPVARLYGLELGDDELLGYCSGWVIVDELHINSLAVAPERRRAGWGRALVEGVLGEAAREGVRAATLEVRRSNLAAQRLYLACGFTIEAVRPDYYEHPTEDALILWHRRVTPPLASPDGE
jgi:ribosomal-protein-alanine N-acetyltransferase